MTRRNCRTFVANKGEFECASVFECIYKSTCFYHWGPCISGRILWWLDYQGSNLICQKKTGAPMRNFFAGKVVIKEQRQFRGWLLLALQVTEQGSEHFKSTIIISISKPLSSCSVLTSWLMKNGKIAPGMHNLCHIYKYLRLLNCKQAPPADLDWERHCSKR